MCTPCERSLPATAAPWHQAGTERIPSLAARPIPHHHEAVPLCPAVLAQGDAILIPCAIIPGPHVLRNDPWTSNKNTSEAPRAEGDDHGEQRRRSSSGGCAAAYRRVYPGIGERA